MTQVKDITRARVAKRTRGIVRVMSRGRIVVVIRVRGMDRVRVTSKV